MDSSGTATGTGNGSAYEKTSKTADNAVDTTIERRENAPGAVRNLHVGVVMDAATTRSISAGTIQALIASAVGIDVTRGDTVQVSSLPFDRTAEKAAKAELAAAERPTPRVPDGADPQQRLIVLVLVILLLAWLKSRRARQGPCRGDHLRRRAARAEQLERASSTAMEPSAALLALESSEQSETEDMLDELAALVGERQPEDVASLLRGWLVERA